MKHAALTIPKPCHENWNEMKPVDQSRICASCEKKVHDFTKSSDHEIIKVLSVSKSVCGRFLNSQLERELVSRKEKSNVWAIAASGILGMLSMTNAQAQQGTKQPNVLVVGATQPQEDPDDNDVLQGDIIITTAIKGVVTDGKKPLAGILVTVPELNTQTRTDSKGSYSIAAISGQKINFTGVGYVAHSIQVNAQTTYYVVLSTKKPGPIEHRFIMGKVAVLNPAEKKENPKSLQK